MSSNTVNDKTASTFGEALSFAEGKKLVDRQEAKNSDVLLQNLMDEEQETNKIRIEPNMQVYKISDEAEVTDDRLETNTKTVSDTDGFV